MVHLLVASQTLIKSPLDGANLPEDRPVVRGLLPLRLFAVSEPIVFQSVANYFDVVVVKKEVVAAVWWLVGPNRNRVFIGPEN